MAYHQPVTFGGSFLAAVALVGIIVVALSLNTAICTSIERGISNVDGSHSGDIITAKWIYFVIAAIVVVILMWFAHSQLLGSWMRSHSHGHMGGASMM